MGDFFKVPRSATGFQRRFTSDKPTDKMRVSTRLPMIEMFHPRKNFNTTRTTTNIARLLNAWAVTITST